MKILTPKSEEWPEVLNRLEKPPEVLFCKGNLDLLKKKCIAIVGTRDCTRYGLGVAKDFARDLSSQGIVVVSGLADGIDTAAHGGSFPHTIAVLGNGINRFYPAHNQKLQEKIIAEGGLVISEHEPDSSGSRYSYPLRNRIIAALSSAVIVIEADYKSGALITKRYAQELGIPVYAVPGNVNSHASKGTNDIIKKDEAQIITSVKDLGLKKAKQRAVQVSVEQQSVLDILRKGELHFDDLIQALKLTPQKLSTLLTNMELDGLIEKLAGNMYGRKEQ